MLNCDGHQFSLLLIYAKVARKPHTEGQRSANLEQKFPLFASRAF